MPVTAVTPHQLHALALDACRPASEPTPGRPCGPALYPVLADAPDEMGRADMAEALRRGGSPHMPWYTQGTQVEVIGGPACLVEAVWIDGAPDRRGPSDREWNAKRDSLLALLRGDA